MNPHIEKINSHLIGVKFSYVNMDWIKEIPAFHIDAASVVLDDGILILNKDYPLYDFYKRLFAKFMTLSDKDLEFRIQEGMELLKTGKFGSFEEDLVLMVETEKERRARQKDYNKAVNKQCKLWGLIFS